MKKKKVIFTAFFAAISLLLYIGLNPVSAVNRLLKNSIKRDVVTRLQ